MYAPLGVKSRDKGGRLRDYTETGELCSTIGRCRRCSGLLLVVQRHCRSSGLEITTGSSARKRGRRFLEGLSPQWGPMTDLLRRHGRCGHPVYVYARVPRPDNKSARAVFGHRSIFYCNFSRPERRSEKRPLQWCKLTSFSSL